MEDLPWQDLLYADPRATCILDLSEALGDIRKSTFWRNRALEQNPCILDDALPDERVPGQTPTVLALNDWLAGRGPRSEISVTDASSSHTVFGYTIANRWRVTQWTPKNNSIVPAPFLNCAQGSSPARKSSHDEALEDILADRNIITAKLATMASVIEMVDVGFYEYDMDGRLVQANDAFYKLSGHVRVNDPSELPETSFADHIFEEDRELVLEKWEALKQGHNTTFEMRWKRPKSNTSSNEPWTDEGQWVLAACVPTRNKTGDIISISGCITDIAAQKRIQQEVFDRAEALERAYASEKRFGRFCEYASVPIVITDPNFRVTYANREWFAIIDHPIVDFEEVDWTPYVHEDGLLGCQQDCMKVLELKKPHKFFFRLKKEWSNECGSHPMWIMACAYPELNDDGAIVSVAATLVDVSYYKWAEEVQQQRIEEVITAKRQQENFIDFTCHEVRNPLGAVIHSAEIIGSTLATLDDIINPARDHLSEEHSAELAAFVEGIEDSVNTIMSCERHQKRIMDDILTLSKLDSSLLTISPAPVRLDNVLTDVERMFEKDAQKMGVALRISRDPKHVHDVQEWASLDAGRLMQVLINLITNALKFTQNETKREVTIIMRLSRHRLSEQELGVEFVPTSPLRAKQDRAGTHESYKAENGSGHEIFVSFTVNDTGCGFNEAQKLTIFERFAQASPRTHTKYGGSGLGLFITRELIELQGGAIGVSARPNHGATFAFYIAARAIDAPLRRDSEMPSVSVSTEEQHYSILLVEDNLVNQKVIRKQLEKLGHTVHLASHGFECIEFLQTSTCWAGTHINDTPPPSAGTPRPVVDVIALDVEMPIMDGLTCARRIRELEAEGRIVGRLPIIAVSANARYEQVSQAIESGMDDAITKPFRIQELVAKLDRLIETSGSLPAS